MPIGRVAGTVVLAAAAMIGMAGTASAQVNCPYYFGFYPSESECYWNGNNSIPPGYGGYVCVPGATDHGTGWELWYGPAGCNQKPAALTERS